MVVLIFGLPSMFYLIQFCNLYDILTCCHCLSQLFIMSYLCQITYVIYKMYITIYDKITYIEYDIIYWYIIFIYINNPCIIYVSNKLRILNHLFTQLKLLLFFNFTIFPPNCL